MCNPGSTVMDQRNVRWQPNKAGGCLAVFTRAFAIVQVAFDLHAAE